MMSDEVKIQQRYGIKAVTNKDFPLLKEALHNIFNIELDYDPALKKYASYSVADVIHSMFIPPDTAGRIRIIFIDNTADLSCGMFRDTDIIGFNMFRKKLVFVAIPEAVEPISEECPYVPVNIDNYLLSVTFHELYENLTGDVRHCNNPGSCINSVCKFYENGTCCVCMAGLIDRKYPDITIDDLYCGEHAARLKKALAVMAGLE